MAIQLPTNRLGTKQIQVQKRTVPLDQIIAIQGQNPMATGVEALGSTIGKTLQQRYALRQQGEQLGQIAQLAGTPAPMGDTGLTPDIYEKGLTLKSNEDAKKAAAAKERVGLELKLEQMRKGYSEVDPTTGKITQYPGVQGLSIAYDAQGNPTIQRGPDYKAAVTPPKDGAGNEANTYIGNDSASGRPMLLGSKTKKVSLATLPDGSGQILPKNSNQPTATTRSSGEFASTVIPHIQDLKDQIVMADKAGYLGPLRGRYQQFMTGDLGTTGNASDDYMLGKLRSTRDFLASGAMKAHVGNRGGGELLNHFISDMDTGKQSAAVLQGELDGLLPYMEGYREAGQGKTPGLNKINSPLTGAKKSLADKLGL